ncbi:MAG: alternative ribosome rescue aminoacyl-tRNA hydrolase ArfB [Deltaproteobacteria bacterium]|nr:alternative ribosome rescue aminoacyl-tRNA hydrolase ArfB [Deltaproteobacteria bacterium]
MISVTTDIVIDEAEISMDFVRSSGPGGQNVNKVSTAVQLRFDVRNTPSLPAEIRERLIRQAGRRVTTEGVLIIQAARFRTQERNRQDAVDRLIELVRRAAEKPKHRVKTRPTLASKERQLTQKRRRGRIKKMRRIVTRDDD